ncbi:M23 family metallopeptidase [Timonella sp. A28]|uniref:M23 family metallopeptidase n=1 Tax=Timonella sp. A28 TaxID=3442640 RepID=UPI003EBFFD06
MAFLSTPVTAVCAVGLMLGGMLSPSALTHGHATSSSDRASHRLYSPIRDHSTLPIEGLPPQASRQALRAAGIIMHDFDPPAEKWLPGHRGIDFATQPNDSVFAPRAGVLTFIGKVAGKPVVVIKHEDNTRSTFEPVTAVLPKGTTVQAGQVIGQVTPSSYSHCADACVHWGVLRGDTYIDPWRLIQPWRTVVLLE